MINWSMFQFIRPMWLWALIPVVLVLWFIANKQAFTGAWRASVDVHLLPHLLVGRDHRRHFLPVILLGTGLILSVIALAGPTWSKLPQAVYKADVTRVILLDLSRSMDVEDIKPSRLSRAKFKVLDLLEKIKEGQVGMVVFAAEPYIVSPLTDDSATIAAMIPTLQTQLMPAQGSRLDLALKKAGQLLQQTAAQHGDILVVTDGINNSSDAARTRDAITSLRKKGHRVSFLGIGTETSAPIPLPAGGFYKDGSGQIVIPKYDVARIKKLAQVGGGIFTVLSISDADIDQYLSLSGTTNIHNIEDEYSQTTDIWRDEGGWLVLILLPLALFVFRRGALPVIFLIFLLPMPELSYASGWSEYFLRNDQQAAKILEKKEYKEAAEVFENADWKGTAYYRGGEYQQAVESFSKSKSPDANYNLGNALAKSGKIEDAIKAYQRVLESNADHEDARFNLSLLENLQRNSKDDKQSNGDKDKTSEEKSENDSNHNNNKQAENGDSQADDSPDKQGASESDQAGDSSDKPGSNKKASQDQSQDSQDAGKDSSEKSKNNPSAEKEPEENESVKARMDADKEQKESASEMKQATEQWLSRIKDDPGGLLREKFIREHHRRQARSQSSQSTSQGEAW